MIAWWLQAVSAASIRGGIALLVALALCRIPCMPALVRCWLWRAAYIVLLIAFFWTTPVKVPLRPPAVIAPDIGGVRDDTFVSPGSVQPAGGPVRPAVAPNASAVTAMKKRAAAWPAVAFYVWVAFVVTSAGRLTLGWYRARRIRSAPSVDVPELTDLCQLLGLRRVPTLRSHPTFGYPMLIGLWWPSIMLPEWVMQSPQRRAILAHELAHLKRLDLLWNWIPTLALALLPLHPLVWIGNRQWHLATESACDAVAVRSTNIDPVAYVRMLIHAATAPPARRSSVLALAMAAESSWLLKRRVSLMQTITSWSRRRLIVAGLILGVFVLAAAVPWRVVAQNPPATMPAQASKSSPVPMGAGPTTAPSGRHWECTGVVNTTTDVLRTATGGTVAKIAVSVGKSVKRGDILVEMDRTVADADLNGAKAKVAYEEKDVADKKQQYDRGLGASGEVRLAETQLDLAQIELVRAQHELDALRIAAPFDGIVTECNIQVGDVLEPHQAVATVLQTGVTQVDLELPLGVARTLKPGAAAKVEFDVGKSRVSLAGTVQWIAPFVDPATQTQKVTVEVTTSRPELIPGMFVNVSFDSPR